MQHWLVRLLFFDAAELVDALLPQLSSAAAVPMGSQSLLPGISRSSARQPGCVALGCVALSDTSASICASQPGNRAASLQPSLAIPSKRCIAISHDAEKFPGLVVSQLFMVNVPVFFLLEQTCAWLHAQPIWQRPVWLSWVGRFVVCFDALPIPLLSSKHP